MITISIPYPRLITISILDGLLYSRAFRTSESADLRVRKLFMHLYCKEVNISQKNSDISIFSFFKSYYSLYKPHAQISTIVKTSLVFHSLIILGQCVGKSRSPSPSPSPSPNVGLQSESNKMGPKSSAI
jgi:hypothetical protein